MARGLTNLWHALRDSSKATKLNHQSELVAGDMKVANDSCSFSFKSEVNYPADVAKSATICNTHLPQISSILQLERDVQNLEWLLYEEMEVHAVLESAIEQAALEKSDLSRVPPMIQTLLYDIARLEMTVSSLEEKIGSLQFQLIQERNERRLAEYHFKHLCSRPFITGLFESSSEQEDKAPFGQTVGAISEGLTRRTITEDLWNFPNLLSEEMVRCMKNIFITLENSSSTLSGSPTCANPAKSASPLGNLSDLSSLSPSEQSRISPEMQSPQVDVTRNNDVLTLESVFDPYKARDKLCWRDIGNYGLALEVSWMSVEQKQLEYAACALKKFRSLVEQLAKVNPIHLSSDESLAFWINIFNALIMHAYLAYGVPRSDPKFFSLMQKAAYTVGGHSFSAACIEYVILKMKPTIHRPQTALLLTFQKLKVSEEQKKFSINKPEPLVAFALSCGMYSSPAVKIYSARKVHEELQEAQRDFVRASVGISSKGKLLIPKMLHCFAREFIDDSRLATWICAFLPHQQALLVEQCMSRRRQSFLASRSFGLLSFDSRFRYLFLPEVDDVISSASSLSHFHVS